MFKVCSAVRNKLFSTWVDHSDLPTKIPMVPLALYYLFILTSGHSNCACRTILGFVLHSSDGIWCEEYFLWMLSEINA